jgi:hypothetical protein
MATSLSRISSSFDGIRIPLNTESSICCQGTTPYLWGGRAGRGWKREKKSIMMSGVTILLDSPSGEPRPPAVETSDSPPGRDCQRMTRARMFLPLTLPLAR